LIILWDHSAGLITNSLNPLLMIQSIDLSSSSIIYHRPRYHDTKMIINLLTNSIIIFYLLLSFNYEIYEVFSITTDFISRTLTTNI